MLLKSVFPILYLLKCSGLLPLSVVNFNNKYKVVIINHHYLYTICFLCLLCVTYIYEYYMWDRNEGFNFGRRIVLVRTFIILFSFAIISTSLISTWVVRTKLRRSLELFLNIDHTFQHQKIIINYDKIKWFTLLFTGYSIAYLFVFSFSLFLIYRDPILPLLYISPTSVCVLSNVQITSSLYLLKYYFRIINNKLKNCWLVSPIKKSMKLSIYFYCALHSQLFELTYHLCSSLSILLFTNITYNITHALTELFFIHESFLKQDYTVVPPVTGLIVITLFNIIVVVHACVAVSEEANITPAILHCIANESGVVELRDVVEEYSIKLMNKKLSFSAAGIFDVNFTLIHDSFRAMVTFSILLLQYYNINTNKET